MSQDISKQDMFSAGQYMYENGRQEQKAQGNDNKQVGDSAYINCPFQFAVEVEMKGPIQDQKGGYKYNKRRQLIHIESLQAKG